ncbi:MAG: hypothetical protein IPK09_07555 [Candidatus Competibacteraceae bacterium]|nr:hypothetical protein [Candidatus Competibacteraceae bacterium]
MIKPWINEDIFKTWTEAQRRLWDSLCSAVPFKPPTGIETWRETYLKNLEVWESAVRKTLSQEASWVQRWVKQVAQENGSPEIMTAWVQQMEEVLKRWVQTQNQWWDEYFAVLRRGGEFARASRERKQPDAVTKSVASTAAGVKPAAAEPAPKTLAAATSAAVSAPPAGAPVAAKPPTTPGADPGKAPAPPAGAATSVQPDDLKSINGIGPALEKKLQAQGIFSYRQLAALNDADITRLETAIKAAGRIRRDDWAGQAKTQHLQKYHEQL